MVLFWSYRHAGLAYAPGFALTVTVGGRELRAIAMDGQGIASSAARGAQYFVDGVELVLAPGGSDRTDAPRLRTAAV